MFLLEVKPRFRTGHKEEESRKSVAGPSRKSHCPFLEISCQSSHSSS